MQALDADLAGRPVRHTEDKNPLADDRLIVLADLIALRQVGVEIVLSREDATLVDLGLEAKAALHGLLDAMFVEHRKHAGHSCVDERDLCIRATAEVGGSAREQLSLRYHLGVD